MRFQDEATTYIDGKKTPKFYTAIIRKRNRLKKPNKKEPEELKREEMRCDASGGSMDRKEMNRRLRDENITVAEEKGRPELKNDQKKGTDLNLTASQIRKKLRRVKHAKNQNQ